VLAEWVTEGATEWDMWACDPRRFTDFTDDAYCVEKAREVYGHEYAMHFPWHRWPAAPDRKVSPVHDRIVEMGGQMGVYAGWERANWFAAPGDDTSEAATHTWGRAGPWEPRIREECLAVRDGVGVLDLPGFSRFHLTGPGAGDWLLGLIAGGLPKAGRIGLAYFPDHRGRVLTEMTVACNGEGDYTLITAAVAQWHDREWLERTLPKGLTLRDRTREMSTLIVTGPASRALFAAISDAELTRPWLSHDTCTVAGHKAALARVSFAGELGWEVHAPVDQHPRHPRGGAGGGRESPSACGHSTACGSRRRTARGRATSPPTTRFWKPGSTASCSFEKPQDFPGKAALLAERQRGTAKRFAVLTVDAGEADAPPMSTIWHEGRVVGEATSGGWGYRVGASIALCMVRADLCAPGTALEVEIYGERRPAVVQGDGPLWDPGNERLKA
jgi:dimethylglycine dehydrogenase